MARRNWTPDDLAEIRRRWRIGFTYAEIATHFGVSRQSVVLTVRRYGLISPGEARSAAAKRSRGVPKSLEHKRKLAAMQRSKWTPERRAKTSEIVKARRATDEGRAEIQRALQIVARNKRGFDVPDHLRDEYRFLRRNKNIPAREAGAIIGLIPQPQATGGR